MPSVIMPALTTNHIPEHVDVQRLSQRGIKLGYTPDVLTDAGIPLPTSIPQHWQLRC